jgi:Holliday junction resolvase RusA-like endonuclease
MLIKIPIKAMSVNKAWQGRRFKTEEYKQYEKDCMWWIKGRKIEGDVEIHYRFYLKNYTKTDVSNLIKLLEDIIVKQGLIQDDRFVKFFQAEKFRADEDSIEIEIIKYS